MGDFRRPSPRELGYRFAKEGREYNPFSQDCERGTNPSWEQFERGRMDYYREVADKAASVVLMFD